MALSEADTCRKYVLPKLYVAGWNDGQITEQKTFTDGRIICERRPAPPQETEARRLPAAIPPRLHHGTPAGTGRENTAVRGFFTWPTEMFSWTTPKIRLSPPLVRRGTRSKARR